MKLTDKTNLAGPVQVDEVNWRILQVGIFIQLEPYLQCSNFRYLSVQKRILVH